MILLSFKTYQSLKFFKLTPSSQGKLRPLANTNSKNTICSLLYLHVKSDWYFKYFIFNLSEYYDCCITPAAFHSYLPTFIAFFVLLLFLCLIVLLFSLYLESILYYSFNAVLQDESSIFVSLKRLPFTTFS